MLRKTRRLSIVMAPLMWAVAQVASAVPIISVDMDPSMAGIQSTLSVTPGTTFTVDVVISDDGFAPTPTVFDTTILEVSFNDSAPVLSLGPTGPVAGALAGNSMFTSSFFGPPGLLVPGTTVLGTGPSFPQPGFAGGSGAIGLFDPLVPFTIVPGPATSIFSIDFTAGVLGFPSSSTILAAGTPPGSPELALTPLGSPPIGIFANLNPGTVNVGVAAVVVEPSTLALLSLGLGGLVLGHKRGRRA